MCKAISSFPPFFISRFPFPHFLFPLLYQPPFKLREWDCACGMWWFLGNSMPFWRPITESKFALQILDSQGGTLIRRERCEISPFHWVIRRGHRPMKPHTCKYLQPWMWSGRAREHLRMKFTTGNCPEEKTGNCPHERKIKAFQACLWQMALKEKIDV